MCLLHSSVEPLNNIVHLQRHMFPFVCQFSFMAEHFCGALTIKIERWRIIPLCFGKMSWFLKQSVESVLKTVGFIFAHCSGVKRNDSGGVLFCFFVFFSRLAKVERESTTRVNISYIVSQSICPTVEDCCIVLFLCWFYMWQKQSRKCDQKQEGVY